MDQIVNSINLIDFDRLKDKAAYGEEDPQLMTLADQLAFMYVTELISLYFGPYALALFGAAMVLVALVAPILIRFAIYRRPIKSVWVAIAIAAAFLIINTVVMSYLSKLGIITQATLLLTALTSYLILRKGHKQFVQPA